MHHTRYRTVLNLILLFSIFALIAAYFIQYVLGHEPCNLCLIERIPYFLIIIVIISSFLFKKYEKIHLALLSLIFILASLISFYHVGIEQGFIEESLVCDLKNGSNLLLKEDILKQLREKNVNCKDVTFKILGLSLTSYNILISLLITISTIRIYLNYDKNR